MSKNGQAGCQLTQQIEKDYISSMLGITELANELTDEQAIDQVIDQTEIAHELIDYNAPYKKTDFECQIFNIAGLSIAVATESISEIVKQQTLQSDSEPSKTSILAGTINAGGETIKVIDLEYLVMSGIGDRDELRKHKHSLVDIVLIKGSTTGFIGNQLIDRQTISNQQVHWRDEKSERIWLAGTVAQRGVALLDIEGVIKLLNRCIK